MVGRTLSGADRRQTVSNQSKPAVFLYEAEDAERFLRDQPDVRCVVTLTPNARARLIGIDRPVITAPSRMSERDHLRVVAAGHRSARQLDEALASDEVLDLSARETLIHNVQLVTTISYRMWFFLGKTGPWLLWNGNEWHETGDRAEAHASLLDTLMRSPSNFRPTLQDAKWPVLCQFMNRLAARLIAWRRPFLITGYHYGLNALSDQATRAGLWPLQLRFGGGWSALAHPFRCIALALLGRSGATLIGTPHPVAKAEEVACKMLDRLGDPILERSLQRYRSTLVTEVGLTQGLVSEFRALIRIIGARTLLAHSLRWGDEAALAEAGGQEGVERVLISHGSHTRPDRRSIMEIIRTHARGLLVSPLADMTIVQSPHAEELAKELDPNLKRIRSRPVMWGYKHLPLRDRGVDRRRILHAGTFKPHWGPRTFMYEMSDEFVDGIAKLIKAVSEMPDTELVVRVRPAAECSVSSLEALLPKVDNCIMRCDGAFLDDLAQSDLLVSYSSTTIEESIHARRPVLLWGGAQRYRHIAARVSPPTAGDRNAVYAVDNDNDLPPMLDAILDVHSGVPLDDGEIRPHVWFDIPSAEQQLFDCLKDRATGLD